MNWTDIDRRLAALGKDRLWLSSVTKYSEASVREALAPNGKKRSDRMLTILSSAIEDEEAKHGAAGDLEKMLAFEPEEWAEIVVLATRAGQEPRDWIRSQILAYLAWCARVDEGREPDSRGYAHPSNPVPSLEVAESAEASESGPGKGTIHPLPGAGDVKDGESSRSGDSKGNA